MAGNMEGRVGFVTGGGSGMGRETAALLAAAGAAVAVADRNEDGARETAAAIEATGGKAFPIALDVSDSGAVNAAMAAALLRTSRLGCSPLLALRITWLPGIPRT